MSERGASVLCPAASPAIKVDKSLSTFEFFSKSINLPRLHSEIPAMPSKVSTEPGKSLEMSYEYFPKRVSVQKQCCLSSLGKGKFNTSTYKFVPKVI